MRRFLLLIFIAFYLNSCVEEYDYFTPYVNNSVSYIDQFKSKTLSLTFSNANNFEYNSESGLQLRIPANSFATGTNKISLLIDYNTSLLDIISSRLQTGLSDGKIYSFDKVLNLRFRDESNNKIDIDANKQIEVKMPFEKNNSPVLFNFNNGFWLKSPPETNNIFKSTWYTNDIDSILVKGYKIKLNRGGQIALASELNSDDEINDLNIRLDNGFDVNNSLVLLTIKNTNAVITLKWDTENKVFKLPGNTVLPSSDVIVLVFSEDSDKNIYFGMNYAKVINGDILEIKPERKKIEDIKRLIKSISM